MSKEVFHHVGTLFQSIFSVSKLCCFFSVFQKLRTPARPAKDIDDEDEALSDFIVSDSDVESDEDAFYSRLTWLHDADSFFQ